MDSATPPWATLPHPVRDSILQALPQDSDGCSLAGLAVVSREWQNVIERHTFARIKLTLPRLEAFGSMVRRNRSRVKYIWLCVELEHYSSIEAYTGDDESVSQRDFDLVKKAFEGLFNEISEWEPREQLILDISVHSPSDSNYLLKYLTFQPDMPSNECLSLADVGNMGRAGRSWNDWVAADRAGTSIKKMSGPIEVKDPSPDEEAYDREMEWLDDLLNVPAVTGVLLRQQTRRRWCSSTLIELLDHFPNLQEVFYEPWRALDPDSQREADKGYDDLIEHLTRINYLARHRVRKLTIFENYNRHYSSLFPGYKHARSPMPGSLVPLMPESLMPESLMPESPISQDPMPESDDNRFSKSLNRTAAEGSLQLEHFSASYLIDAALFFASCRPSWTWPILTSLTLTSPWLAPDVERVHLVKMLTTAATLASRMPKLETMELWNGRKRLATLFQYRSKPATITWRSTWHFSQFLLTIPAWEGVARDHGAGELAVEEELVRCGDIRSHGDAIHFLKLSHPVVRPISLQQIRTEHKVHRIWEEMRAAKG